MISAVKSQDHIFRINDNRITWIRFFLLLLLLIPVASTYALPGGDQMNNIARELSLVAIQQQENHSIAVLLPRYQVIFSVTKLDPSQLKNAIETSVQEHNHLHLEQLAQNLELALTETPGEETAYITYYLGYINYRLFTEFDSSELSDRDATLNRAVTALESAVELYPDYSEAAALLASCYGLKATGLFRAVRYGRKYIQTIERALELDPDNPRVLFIDAIGMLKKPAIFGGSTDGAVNRFHEAINAFSKRDVRSPDASVLKSETEITSSGWAPEWGLADAYAWLGYAHLQNGQNELARQALESALAERPEYRWVTEELMPRLGE